MGFALPHSTVASTHVIRVHERDGFTPYDMDDARQLINRFGEFALAEPERDLDVAH